MYLLQVCSSLPRLLPRRRPRIVRRRDRREIHRAINAHQDSRPVATVHAPDPIAVHAVRGRQRALGQAAYGAKRTQACTVQLRVIACAGRAAAQAGQAGVGDSAAPAGSWPGADASSAASYPRLLEEYRIDAALGRSRLTMRYGRRCLGSRRRTAQSPCQSCAGAFSWALARAAARAARATGQESV